MNILTFVTNTTNIWSFNTFIDIYEGKRGTVQQQQRIFIREDAGLPPQVRSSSRNLIPGGHEQR